MTDIYNVSKKIIVSSRFVEIYEYEKPYIKGFPKLQKKFVPEHLKRSRPQTSVRLDNLRVVRQKIRRLINSNEDLDKFLTITFNSPVLCLTDANKKFDIFIKRLKRRYPDLKYLAVPEFQSVSKRVHYHILCNLPYVDVNYITNKVWGNGFCFLRNIYGDNYGAYVCKYLSKEIFDKRYFKKRKFLYSRNLLRPVIIDRLIDVKECFKLLFKKKAIKTFKMDILTDFLGMVKYTQIQLAESLKVVLLE